MEVFYKIINLLENNNIKYELKEHLPTYTSEESAKYRNEPLKIGAKTLILKYDNEFLMCIISASKKLDSKKLKNILKTKKLRFAIPKEIKEKTNCVPGSIPPFGNLFNLKMLTDKSILENEFIAFNAGLLTKSIKLKKDDYINIINLEVVDVSK